MNKYSLLKILLQTIAVWKNIWEQEGIVLKTRIYWIFRFRKAVYSNTAKVRWKSLQQVYRKFPAESNTERIMKIGVPLSKLWPKKQSGCFWNTVNILSLISVTYCIVIFTEVLIIVCVLYVLCYCTNPAFGCYILIIIINFFCKFIS